LDEYDNGTHEHYNDNQMLAVPATADKDAPAYGAVRASAVTARAAAGPAEPVPGARPFPRAVVA